MSSDSSDDEENLALLREATDHQFINDSMFKSGHPQEKDVSETLPSLRPSKQEDQFNFLGVTPEFQAYVARHLASKLEDQLKHALTSKAGVSMNMTQSNNNGGIKLLRDSKHFIKIENKMDVAKVNKKRRLEDDFDSEEINFTAVSVTPEQILNKVDVTHWSNRSKAQVFRYRKIKSGLLVCVDDKTV